MVEKLPTMQETRVQSLGWKDPLEKCQGPAPAGSRGTLRMNGVGKRERKRNRERETRLGCAAESGNALFFTLAFIP